MRSVRFCTSCKEDRPVTQFGLRGKNRDNFESWCFECKNSRLEVRSAKVKARVEADGRLLLGRDAIWTLQEEKFLVDMRVLGVSYDDIAFNLGRTIRATTQRLYLLRKKGVPDA